MNINTSDVSRYNYNEAEALQQLLVAVDIAADDFLERCQQHDDWTGQFTINIAGQSVAFHIGGPQIDALYDFVQHIADENFYSVDFENNTVISHLI